MLKPVRQRALNRAKEWIGVKEHPAGTNRGPVLPPRGDPKRIGGIDNWCLRANGLVGYPWCSAFVCAMYSDEGRRIEEPRRASVGFFEEWARNEGLIVARPLKGDLVCYRFDSDNWPDHIGFVEKVLALRWKGKLFAGWIKTIEGNTSAGNDANGGQVQRRYRWVDGRQKFVRITGI